MEAIKNILRVLLPTLGAVKGAPVFNNGVAAAARSWSPAIREAAYVDGIVVTDLQTVIDRLAGAAAFESQQDAISDALAIANDTLDAVSDGSIARLDRSLRPLDVLLRQIRENAVSMIDVFNPNPDKIEHIRKATAQVVPIIEAELRDKERSQDAHDVVLHLEDSTRRLSSPHYQVREAATDAVIKCIDRLAA